MINTHELRLGNKVMYLNKKVITVTQINGNHISGKEILTASDCEISGIRINPEWLFKLGARLLPHGYFIGKLKFTYEHNELSEFVRFHYSGKVAYLQYVHQLQNLVYAIAGTEIIPE